jgi:hypothetical protein
MAELIPINLAPEIAVAIGLFFGCLCRTLLPFFKKQYQAAQEGKQVKWESRYTWTLIFALFTAFIAATLLFPTVEVPVVNAFPISFAVGWSAQDILNTIVK